MIGQNQHMMLFISLLGVSQAIQAFSREEAFIKKHRAPQFIEEALREHTDFLTSIIQGVEDNGRSGCKEKHGHLVWKVDSLPGYFIKWGIGRIKGAERMRDCIESHNLDLLTVPRKYLYHIPGKARNLNNKNYLVIAEEYKRAPGNFVLNLAEAKQISILIKEAGYGDITDDNLFPVEGSNKLVIIDTEADFIFKKKRAYFAFGLLFAKWGRKLNCTKEALAYFFSQFLACRPQEKRYYGLLYSKIIKGLSSENFRQEKWQPLLAQWKEMLPKPSKPKRKKKWLNVLKYLKEPL